jgi:hypothetical protein
MDNCGDGIRLEITAQGSRFRVQRFRGYGRWPLASGFR